MAATAENEKWMLCAQCGLEGKMVPADLPPSVLYLCDSCSGDALPDYVPLSDEAVQQGDVPEISVEHHNDRTDDAGHLLMNVEFEWGDGRTRARMTVPNPDLKATAERWLLQEMEELKQGRMRPERDPTLDASHVCYNCATQACCFDFVPWIIDAEMIRVRAGAPAPLKVGFVSGPSGNVTMFSPKQHGMFNNVMRPALRLVGAVENEAAKRGRGLEIKGYGPITLAARCGEKVPRFKSPVGLGVVWAQKPVVITLRECDHNPERNSSLVDWLWFAKHLTARGERVIFVRDTANADEGLPFETWPQASKDLLIRMALYEQAKCLFFVSNGPWNLGLFSHRPYAAFINAADNDPCNTPASWRDNQGVPVGTQFPWAHEQQRVFWQPDRYRNLCDAWDKLALA